METLIAAIAALGVLIGFGAAKIQDGKIPLTPAAQVVAQHFDDQSDGEYPDFRQAPTMHVPAVVKAAAVKYLVPPTKAEIADPRAPWEKGL